MSLNVKLNKVKLKVNLKKVKRWQDNEDGDWWFSYYPVTQIHNILSKYRESEAPTIYVTKISGSESRLRYTITFESEFDRREVVNYLMSIFIKDELFNKGFEILELK